MMKITQSLASQCHMKYSLKPKVLQWPFESMLQLPKAGSLLKEVWNKHFTIGIKSMGQNFSKIVLSKSHPVEKYVGATVNMSRKLLY